MEVITVDFSKYGKADVLQTDGVGKVTSVCYDDCLKDEESSDIEDNTCEFVIMSDSEDEKDQENRLKTLYFRLEKMSLGEIVNLDDNDNSDEAGPSKILKLAES